MGIGRALVDFDGPLAEVGESAAQLVAGIGAIGKEVAQPRVQTAKRGQKIDRAVAVLDVGRMDADVEVVALRIVLKGDAAAGAHEAVLLHGHLPEVAVDVDGNNPHGSAPCGSVESPGAGG